MINLINLQFEADKEKLKASHKEEMETLVQSVAQKNEEDVANAKVLVEQKMEDKLKQAREEHADELKNLHSQHHRKVS